MGGWGQRDNFDDKDEAHEYIGWKLIARRELIVFLGHPGQRDELELIA